MLSKMTIGVFFGGKNTEHDVSIITGQLIIAVLKEMKHEVIPVYISKDGQWFIDQRMDNIEFFKSLDSKDGLKKFSPAMMELSEGAKTSVKTGSFSKKLFKIDLAFPAFHGLNGEDGTVQGLFELLNIPYVGCDVASSALAADKVLTKLFYQRFNIPTTNFTYFTNKEWVNNKSIILEDIKANLTWPLIIKPARLGSSIGISKAKIDEELEFAIEVALHYDEKVIVEDCVEDLKDLTVAVLGNDEPIASLIQESAYSKDFFSYEDKYLEDGGAQLGNAEKKLIIPANLDNETTQQIRDMAVQIYKLFGCSGTARVDFLYSNIDKKFYANEINPLPGTLYHHLWKKSGIELKDLISKLIELAQEKYNNKQKLTYTFDSDILKLASKDKMKLKGV